MKLIKNIYTPKSILENKEKYSPIAIGKRLRFATCTSVCWLNDNIIASLNLYGDKIQSYFFNKNTMELTLLQEITNKDGANLSMCEHFSISACKKYIAICSDMPNACVNIYKIDDLILPIPIFTITEKTLIHNVRFTLDGKYLAYVTFDKLESIKIFKIIIENNIFRLYNIFCKDNEYESIRAKAINFTKDGKFVIICYCTAAVDSVFGINSCITSYKFNPNGTIGEKISEIKDKLAIEDIIFINNDNNILVSDQSNDRILNYKFNKENGEIKEIQDTIENPDGCLSFPHGMSISDNNKYLAVSNYGDDKFNIYEL